MKHEVEVGRGGGGGAVGAAVHSEFLDYYRNARSCVFRLRFMRVLVLYFYFSVHYQQQPTLRIQQKQQFLLRHQLLLPHLRH